MRKFRVRIALEGFVRGTIEIPNNMIECANPVDEEKAVEKYISEHFSEITWGAPQVKPQDKYFDVTEEEEG